MAQVKKTIAQDIQATYHEGYKQWNKSIQVEVSIDSIADRLRMAMVDDNPHKEMIVETIIDTALTANNISYLYNSLMGFSNKVNFEIGQQIYSPERVYQDGDYHPIGNCEILDINPYASDKLYVKYMTVKGSERHQWIRHTNVTEPQPEEAISEEEQIQLP